MRIRMAQMRAGHLQENVRAIRGLGADLFARVSAREPGLVEQIERALRTDWLDISCDVRLTEALYQEIGTDGVRRVNREALVASGNGPLLSPMREGILRLFGFSPASALKWFPRGWAYIYKDLGEARYLVARKELHIEGLPRAAVESVGWSEGCAGAVLGVMDLMGGSEPTVELERHVAEGLLLMKVDWRGA